MSRTYSNYYFIKVVLCLIMTLGFLAIGCASLSVKEKDMALERARAAYQQAKADIQITVNAPVEMYEAEQALQKAEQALDIETMKHLAYIAERKSQIAVAVAQEKIAEKEIDNLNNERTKILLESRELDAQRARGEAEARALEAERAKKEAETRALEIERAKGQAEVLARLADQAKKEAEAKTAAIEKAKGEAEVLARLANQARKEAEAKAVEIERAKSEAETRSLELEKAKKEAEAQALEAESARKEAQAKAVEAQLAHLKAEEAIKQMTLLENELTELKAKQTDRGIVLTLRDILFEFGKDNLMPGAMSTIDRLAEFLKRYPERTVLIEGHTDSIGSETYNLGLSQRRADTVKKALMARGISSSQLTSSGYGESHPVASNATDAGRQENRRVEIVILNEKL